MCDTEGCTKPPVVERTYRRLDSADLRRRRYCNYCDHLIQSLLGDTIAQLEQSESRLHPQGKGGYGTRYARQ